MGATLVSRLPKIIATAQPKAQAVVDMVGEKVADGARDRARHLSGDMEEGIEYRRGRARKNATGRVVANDFKTLFHEYGTSKMGAQPMLTPAAEEWREPFRRLIGRIVK